MEGARDFSLLNSIYTPNCKEISKNILSGLKVNFYANILTPLLGRNPDPRCCLERLLRAPTETSLKLSAFIILLAVRMTERSLTKFTARREFAESSAINNRTKRTVS
jgi:hypothetical protein